MRLEHRHARARFQVIGHGAEARAELVVTERDGSEHRFALSELGVHAAVESGAATAASIRRQKAPHEGAARPAAFTPLRRPGA